MKHRKILAAPALAVAAVLMAFAGTASATTLTSPTGTTYTSTVSASSEGSTTLTSSFFATVHCELSSLSGKVEKHGSGTSASGKLSSLSFSGCTDTITITLLGTVIIHSAHLLTADGVEIDVHTSVGECQFTTSKTTIGDVTDSHETGGKATIDIKSASIPVTGGSFFCPSSAVWEGSYVINTPSTLYVD